MSLSPAEVWKRLLDRARQELPDQTFQAWLEPTEALSIEGSTIFVGAPPIYGGLAYRTFGLLSPISYSLGYPLSVAFRVPTSERSVRRWIFRGSATNRQALQPQNGPFPTTESALYLRSLCHRQVHRAAAAAHALIMPRKVYNSFISRLQARKRTSCAVSHETLLRSRILGSYTSNRSVMNDLISRCFAALSRVRRRYRETDLLLMTTCTFSRDEKRHEKSSSNFQCLYDAGSNRSQRRPPSNCGWSRLQSISGKEPTLDSPTSHRVAILNRKPSLIYSAHYPR